LRNSRRAFVSISLAEEKEKEEKEEACSAPGVKKREGERAGQVCGERHPFWSAPGSGMKNSPGEKKRKLMAKEKGGGRAPSPEGKIGEGE